jgi:inorganic triphosphatase YgiF
MEEVEVEIVLPELPDVPRAIEGIGALLGLEPQSLGMTSTYDRMVDTTDLALLSKNSSLRVRQKLENIYTGSEFRLTYKYRTKDHERLIIRDEQKLRLTEPDYEAVLEMLSHICEGVSGHPMETQLIINELAREANLGPKGQRLNVSVDQCSYSLPDSPETTQEIVFELESHGCGPEAVLKAADWVLEKLGGRLATQGKYARGMRLLGRL